MSPAIEGTERAQEFAAFLRRLAENESRALTGDVRAKQIANEYRLARFCGVSPERALSQAEGMVAHAHRVVRADPHDAREPR